MFEHNKSLICEFCYHLAFSLDTEQPDYDLDSDDDLFVKKLKKKMEITELQFEEMIDRLEKGSGQQVANINKQKYHLNGLSR